MYRIVKGEEKSEASLWRIAVVIVCMREGFECSVFCCGLAGR